MSSASEIEAFVDRLQAEQPETDASALQVNSSQAKELPMPPTEMVVPDEDTESEREGRGGRPRAVAKAVGPPRGGLFGGGKRDD